MTDTESTLAESGGSSLASSEQEKAAPLPDGMGLSIEHVRALLAQAHETVVSKDDPILMVITMLNAFLGEVEKLQKRHEAGLSRLMADKTDAYIKGVPDATAQLSKSFSSASAEGIKAACSEHDARLSAFKSNLSWLAASVAVFALVNVAGAVLLRWL